MSGLKPCPFGCKEVPVLHEMHARYPAEGGHEAGSYVAAYQINCHECGIEMIDEYEDALVAKWNTRRRAKATAP